MDCAWFNYLIFCYFFGITECKWIDPINHSRVLSHIASTWHAKKCRVAMTLKFLSLSFSIIHKHWWLKLGLFGRVHEPGESFPIGIIYEITFEQDFFAGAKRVKRTLRKEKIKADLSFFYYGLGLSEEKQTFTIFTDLQFFHVCNSFRMLTSVQWRSRSSHGNRKMR